MKKSLALVVVLVAAGILTFFGIRYWQRRSIERNLAEGQAKLQQARLQQAKLRSESYMEAAALFQKVREKRPQNVEAIAGLIESYLGAENYRDVLRVYQETRSVPGLPPRLITNKGWAELSLADIEINRRKEWIGKAEETFKEAIKSDSQNGQAFVGMGLVSLDNSRLDLSSPMTGFRPLGPFPAAEIADARGYFTKALDLGPSNPEALRGLAIIAHYDGNLDRVVELLKRTKPDDVDSVLLQALIRLSVRPGDAQAVREGLAKLPAVQSKWGRALLFCANGLADYLDGDFDSAQKNLKLAARNDEVFQFPTIRLHLAKVEEARGNWGQAKNEMAELRSQPGFARDPVLLFLLALNAYYRGEANEMDLLLSEIQRVRPDAPDVLLFRASQETNELTRRDIYLKVLDVDPGSFIAHYNLGTIRLRFKDIPAAIEDFKAALQVRPGFLEGRLNLANAYRQAGRLKDAEEQYRTILQESPDEDEAKVGLALVLRDENRGAEALSLLKGIDEEGTTGAIAQLLLARYAMEEGNVSEAIRRAEKALEIDPASYRTRTLLGNLYIQLGKPDEAVRHFQVASRNENDPSYPDALNGLAVAKYLQKDYPAAKDYLDRIIKRAGEFGNTAAFYVNRGDVFYRQGEFPEAEADYQKAEDLDRSSAIASYNLGVLKEAQKEWQRARIHYREAIRRRPAFPEAHYNLGNLYAAIDDRDLAIGEYQQATEDAPDLDDAYVNLAIQLIESGDYEQAIQNLEFASERTEGSVVISNALAIIYLQRDQLDKADQMCSKSLGMDRSNSAARLLRALVRISQARYSDAHELLEGFLPPQELTLSYQTALGIANIRLERLRGGVQNLENALQLARNSPRSRRFLGDALVNLAWGNLFVGRYSESQRLLEEAQDLLEGEARERAEEAIRQLRSI